MLEFNPEFSFEFEEPLAEAFQLEIIESIIETSTLSVEKKQNLLNDLNTLTYTEAQKSIEWLQENQVNRIHAGLNYNQTYILWHMSNI